jgi:hypothetical protein
LRTLFSSRFGFVEEFIYSKERISDQILEDRSFLVVPETKRNEAHSRNKQGKLQEQAA